MKLRKTKTQVAVLRLMLDRRNELLCGADFINEAGLFSGTLYPLLERLEEKGIVRSQWEEIDPREAGRPRRKFYQLTGVGETNARALVAEVDDVGGTPIPQGGLAQC